MDLPQGYLHSLTLCYGLVAQDLASWSKSHSVSLSCIDDIMLSSDCLADLKSSVQSEGSFADTRVGLG